MFANARPTYYLLYYKVIMLLNSYRATFSVIVKYVGNNLELKLNSVVK